MLLTLRAGGVGPRGRASWLSPAGPSRLLLEVRARSPYWQLAALQLCCQPRKGAETLALCGRAERKACACRSSCAGGVQRLAPKSVADRARPGGASASDCAGVRSEPVVDRAVSPGRLVAIVWAQRAERTTVLQRAAARAETADRWERQTCRRARARAGAAQPAPYRKGSVDVRKAGTGRRGSVRIGRARMRE
jgi:hypothetical protein